VYCHYITRDNNVNRLIHNKNRVKLFNKKVVK